MTPKLGGGSCIKHCYDDKHGGDRDVPTWAWYHEKKTGCHCEESEIEVKNWSWWALAILLRNFGLKGIKNLEKEKVQGHEGN